MHVFVTEGSVCKWQSAELRAETATLAAAGTLLRSARCDYPTAAPRHGHVPYENFPAAQGPNVTVLSDWKTGLVFPNNHS